MKPFASMAQIKKCQQLVKVGKMTQQEFDDILAITDIKSLPDRAVQQNESLIRTDRTPRRAKK